MAVVVKVLPGYSLVPLPGGTYNQGQQITLTDPEFASLSSIVLQQLQVISSTADPTPLPPYPSSTASLVEATLEELAAPVILKWSGTDYIPTEFKNSITRTKIFIGPTDPRTVTGVTMSQYDQWIDQESA